MNLYLLRHGIAEEHAASGRDEDRELTEEGREKLTKVLQRAARSGVKPDVIMSSPYKRAVQTARLATRLLEGPELTLTETATPYADPRALWGEVKQKAEAESILVASHEPFLSHTVSYLLDSPGMKVEIKKGAMVSIGFEGLRGEPRGILQWMLIPRLCA
jgi:phosphohistidine phosphatase